MLLGTLGISLLGNLLKGRGAMANSKSRGRGQGINRASKKVLRAGYGCHSSKMDF